MSNILQKICAKKLNHIKQCKITKPETELIGALQEVSPVRGFYNALKASSASGYGLIGEIKKASPSKGLIRDDFNPGGLATAYEKGGACCLSVLTDEPFFQGHNNFLMQARSSSSLPILRKDFMLDRYQITEARSLGADCILLIMAALDFATADRLEKYAFELGMDVILEVHNEEELTLALTMASPLIGINNRNLKTMTTDIATTEKLIALAPSDRLIISESGLATSNDLSRMAAAGARCFLIGESLMRQGDVERATRSLLSNPS